MLLVLLRTIPYIYIFYTCILTLSFLIKMSITVKTVKLKAFISASILIYSSHNPINECIKSSPTLCFFLFNKPFSLGNHWLQLPFHGHKLGHMSQQKLFQQKCFDSHALVSVNSLTLKNSKQMCSPSYWEHCYMHTMTCQIKKKDLLPCQ